MTPLAWPHPRPGLSWEAEGGGRQQPVSKGQSQRRSRPNLAFPQQRTGGVHNPGLFFSVSLAWSRLAARSQPAQIFLSLKTPWTARPAAFLLALHDQCHGDGAANVD